MMRNLLLYTFFTLLTISAHAQKGKIKPTGGKSSGPAQVNIDLRKIKKSDSNGRTFDIPFYPKQLGKILPSSSKAIIKTYSITGLPVWIEGELLSENKIDRSDVRTTAINFIESNSKALQIKDAASEWKVKTSVTEQNLTHSKLQQYFQGIEVWNSEVNFHTKDGVPYLFNGRYIPTPDYINIKPSITVDQALEIAKNIRPIQNYTTSQLKFISEAPISGKLVIYTQIDKTDKGQLAYLITAHPNLISTYQYFIDAHSGQLIDEIKSSCAIHNSDCDHSKEASIPSATLNSVEIKTNANPPLDGPATASAQDLNNVSRQINTYQIGSNYYLIDGSRPMFAGPGGLPDDPKGAVWTIDAGNKSPENDNFGVNHISSSNNTWSSKTAVSAHYNGGIAYEYFRTRFNRNSINGSGGTVISIINVTESNGSGMDNAFWNGSAMFYGNGNTGFKPLAGSLDVAGHEMSHGVIQETANLTYQGESGALNESFADVFGVLIDRDDYKLGEEVVKLAEFPSGALRDVSNPHNGGNSLNDGGYQPAHMNEKYNGSQDNGGVHINSGIVNFAFFKIATKLGKDDAEKIYYSALTKYLTKSSQFIDCRNAVIQAGKDLFGANSPKIGDIENSFAEVGIGQGSGTTDPPDYSVNPGEDFVIFGNASLSEIKLAQISTGTITNLDFTGGLYSKPSVSDDGSLVVFIGKDNSMYFIQFDWAQGQYNIGTLDNQNDWRNVVVSKDGLRLAALLDVEEPVIYIFDLVSNTFREFELYNPTTGNGGVFTGDVEYADAMEFDHTGQYLMYDALSSLGFLGTSYWDIGFMSVWDKSINNYGDGYIEKLFSSLPDGVSVGNPVFSKNSPNVIAFDYIEEDFSTIYQLWGANIETGDANVIFENSTYSYPCFSKDDRYIIFNAESSSGSDVIAVNELASDKISPSGGASILIDNSTWGTWFATGEREISSIISGKTLKDEITIYPNPVTNAAEISWSSKVNSEATINVIDVKGQVVMSQTLDLQNGLNKETLKLNQLSPGTYFIEAQKNQLHKTIKIIKN